MNPTSQHGARLLAVAMHMVPVGGFAAGNAAGVEVGAQVSVWQSGIDGAAHEAGLAAAVAKFPLSNAELLAAAQSRKPPQSWYDEDHEGLY